MSSNLQSKRSMPREGYVPVDGASLYYREVGGGQPIIVLHGGPDFDHRYLLPDMDRLSNAYRLIYYDQRGRGKSLSQRGPEDISISTEIDDLERLRKYLQLDPIAVLGHSWGGHLAMEYAIRHPSRVSHLILMNTSVASHGDYLLMRQEIRGRRAAYEEVLNKMVASTEYMGGDPDAVTATYRIHYGTMIKQPEHLERLMTSLRLSFTKEGILRGREIEDRLVRETWLSADFDLFPKLERLSVPTLVIHGDYDVIPVPCVTRIAQAIPGAHFVLLKDCGHFPYIEAPDKLREAINEFFGSNDSATR